MITPVIIPLETPLKAYDLFTLFKNEADIIFLDSSLEQAGTGQFSFIGFKPFMTFQYQQQQCYINDEKITGTPFELLNRVLQKYKIVNNTPFPFVGGGMGYFSYDLVRDIEILPQTAEEIMDIPNCYFNFYDWVILYDHQHQKAYLSVLNCVEGTQNTVTEVLNRINQASPQVLPCKTLRVTRDFRSRFTREAYMQTVDQMRHYIKEGHIYIANLTHTFTAEVKQDPYVTYQRLRTINPAPFSAFMQIKDFYILSSSPERFMKITDGQVETRPIKGTRPRGNSPEADEANRKALMDSEKDRSELLMVVDLERNDLSKVCKPHSVKVVGLFEIESYATVHHLVARITGTLEDYATAIDCIKAGFPGGSITGTPKLRAMEIIEELEPTRRGIYTGCLGYLGFDGNVDMNIVIRTIIQKDGIVHIGVGGGITWESNGADEYQETLDKAKALFESIY